jgi:glycine/D-amino acid oxidase-like deaminating enzyme
MCAHVDVTSRPQFDALIVGGGFYGARLALMLRATGRRVSLVEREPRLFGRASLRNQARVHDGYHYPRSLLTALRSRLNYSRFVDDYADCVHRGFAHYYAVGRGMSKITAIQFSEFCRRIGAPIAPAPERVTRLFDRARIEAVFAVEECAFDAAKLRARISRDLDQAGVIVHLETEARIVRGAAPPGTGMLATLRTARGDIDASADLILNCTYSGLNRLLLASGAAAIPAKHQLSEIALVEPPPELEGAALTVIDGPFFSLMPYPSRGTLFTLSHVRYTPHATWHDGPGEPLAEISPAMLRGRSRFLHMVRDAERYLPAMRGCRYADSLWEIKTVRPRSEQDDGRPLLLRRSAALPGLITVLGAKMDSIYDVEDVLSEMLARRPAAGAIVA